jgi:hypothetical protein
MSDFIFLSRLDQLGNDLDQTSRNTSDIIAYNSFNLIKSKITNLTCSPFFQDKNQGIYIKKDQCNKILSELDNSQEFLHIDNKQEVDKFIESIKFTGPEGDTIMFTNANSWYIETLVNNLIYSYNTFNKIPNRKIGVFCSDVEGLEKSKKLGFDSCMIYCEKMNIKNSLKDIARDDYRRLSFVKTLIIDYILSKNYTVLYIDPDMSFNVSSYPNTDFINEILNRKHTINYSFNLDDSIQKINNYDIKIDNVMAGNIFYNISCNKYPITTMYLNSNLMLVSPSFYNKMMFKIQISEFEKIVIDPSGSDETYINRVGKNEDYFSFWAERYFPNGVNSEKYKNVAYMFHANCVTGMQNKVELLQKCGGWFLPFIPVLFSLKYWGQNIKALHQLIIQASEIDGSDNLTFCSIGMSYKFLQIQNDDYKDTQIGNHDNLVLCAVDENTDYRRRGNQNKNRKNILQTLRKNNIINQSLMNASEYFKVLPKYKFVISPEGNGIDCHRHYEALLAGCIPIVEYNRAIIDKYGDVPILYTYDYSEITPGYLETKYKEMINNVYDFSKLFLWYYNKQQQDEIKYKGNFWCNKMCNKIWYN